MGMRSRWLVFGVVGALVAACGDANQNSSTQNHGTGQTSSGGQHAANAHGPVASDESDAGAALQANPTPPPEAADGGTASAPPIDPAAGNAPAPPARPAMGAAARDQYRNGLAAAQQGNLTAARGAFEGAMNADPHAYAAAYDAGVIAERQGEPAQADTLYQRALSMQPDYELAVVARARLLERQNRINDAVAMAADIARRYPGNFAVRAEYARLLVDAQRYPDAITEARNVLRADERNVGAQIAIAMAYRAQGHNDLALYIIEGVVNGSDPEHHPNQGPGANDPRAHYLRALLRIEINRDVPGAIQSFTRATELDPQFAEAHNNLGVYLLQAGNNDQAIAHLRAAVALSPSWAKAHLNLGDALRATADYNGATAELQRAQQLDATLNEVQYDYGRLYGAQAAEVPSTGADNLARKLGLLQQAQASFTRFRDALGATYAANPRHDDVEQQLSRLQTLIERTTRARDRAARSQTRGAATPASGGAAPAHGATPATGATPAPTPAAPAAGH